MIWLVVCASPSYALTPDKSAMNLELAESGRAEGAPGASYAMDEEAPQIGSLSPAAVLVGSKATTLTINGTGFTAGAMVQIDLSLFKPTSVTSTAVKVTLPASFFLAEANLEIAVQNAGTPPILSNLVSLPVAAIPTLTSVSPAGAPIGSSDLTVYLSGTGFGSGSVAYFNGEPLVTTGEDSEYLAAVIPASMLTLPGNWNFTIGVSGLPGVISNAQTFTTYLGMASNDILYRSTDGYVYVSIPGSAGPEFGNTVVAIDPATGVVVKRLAVGSEPNRLALSSDGVYLYVGLDAAGAYRRIDLNTGAMSPLYFVQSYFGPGHTALAIAVMPGNPQTVAIYGSEGTLGIYDNGVQRPKTTFDFNSNQQIGGYPAFDPSGAFIYTATNYGLYKLPITAQGLASYTELSPLKNQAYGLQYDAGRLYVSDGEVYNATTGKGVVTFHASGESNLVGPVVSDSTVGKAFGFAFNSGLVQNETVDSFNETTYLQSGSLAVGGLDTLDYPYNPEDLVRWGENGLAFRTGTQIYFLSGPLVRDLTQAPAKLGVKWSVPAALSTGHGVTATATLENNGPNAAQAVTLTETFPASFLLSTVTASRGTCTTAATIVCDLGAVPAGSTVTVSVFFAATTAGTFSGSLNAATENAPSPCSGCALTATMVASGITYAPRPVPESISPALVEAGQAGIELTVTGSGFSENSTVLLNGKPLATTFVSATELTAEVGATVIGKMGWIPVQVSTPSPGGGVSAALPLTIYTAVNVAATSMIFDPFTQNLYATVPSGVVAINPTTGTVGKPLPVAYTPGSLAESSDGNNLFVGVTNAASIARINLPQFKLENTIELPFPFTSPQSPAIDVQPGSDTTLALGYGAVSILDVNGSTSTIPTGESDLYAGEWPHFADATHIYSIDIYGSPQYFYRITLNPETESATITSSFGQEMGSQIEIGQDGLVYGGNGAIVSGQQPLLHQIAVVPNGGTLVAPDTAQGRAFYLQEAFDGGATDSVMRANVSTYVDEATLPLPTASEGYVLADGIVRWGQDGLAILSQRPTSGGNGTPTLLLLRGPFVVPAEAQVNPAPVLTVTAPVSLVHDSGNSYLTVEGSNLHPGAVVFWNGLPLTTTYLDSQHAKVAVPGSDIATAGTVHLTAQNPGSALSNAIALTVD